MTPSRQEILDIFFAAMRAGYVSGASKAPIKELPNSKLITFINEPFRVVDVYFTNPNNNFSSGMTVIYHEEDVVWSMAYQGWYDEKDITFLKEALSKNYVEEIFVGGRGPIQFKGKDGRVYINRCHEWAEKFSGKEYILSPDGTILGEHVYQGRFLINTD